MEIIFEFIFEVIGNLILIPLLNFVGAIIRRIVFFYKNKVDLDYFLMNGKGYNYLLSSGLFALLIYILVK